MSPATLSRRRFVLGSAIAGVAGVGGAMIGGAVGRSAQEADAATFHDGHDATTDHDTTTGDGAVPVAMGTSEIPNEADFGFCADMTAHHVQALDLCQRVLGSDTGDAVQAAAAEVLQTQAMEVGQMRAWLTDWGQSTAPPETVMAWMHDEDGEHDQESMAMDQMAMPLSMMPGYATPAELQELSLADGMAKGRMFLELMRAHHVGGVAMAQAGASLAATTKVRRLAQSQAQVQAFEIAQYDVLLATTYAI